MGYGDFEDLIRRTTSHKISCDEVFNITKNLKYDGYQRVLLQRFINVLMKEILLRVQINLLVVALKICQTSNL